MRESARRILLAMVPWREAQSVIAYELERMWSGEEDAWTVWRGKVADLAGDPEAGPWLNSRHWLPLNTKGLKADCSGRLTRETTVNRAAGQRGTCSGSSVVTDSGVANRCEWLGRAPSQAGRSRVRFPPRAQRDGRRSKAHLTTLAYRP